MSMSQAELFHKKGSTITEQQYCRMMNLWNHSRQQCATVIVPLNHVNPATVFYVNHEQNDYDQHFEGRKTEMFTCNKQDWTYIKDLMKVANRQWIVNRRKFISTISLLQIQIPLDIICLIWNFTTPVSKLMTIKPEKISNCWAIGLYCKHFGCMHCSIYVDNPLFTVTTENYQILQEHEKSRKHKIALSIKIDKYYCEYSSEEEETEINSNSSHNHV